MPTMNRQITLAARPVGMPKPSDFRLEESTMPSPGGGEVLVQALYLSVDPYMRGRLTGVTTYARGLDLGEVIVGGVVGRVLKSNDPRYSPGDIVEGMLGWQEYGVAPAKSLRRIDPAPLERQCADTPNPESPRSATGNPGLCESLWTDEAPK